MSSKVTKAAKSKGAKAKTAVDYLPDADEIERSPLPRFAQFTLHILMGALVAFLLWASLAQLEQVVAAQGSLVNPLPNIVVQPLETSIIQSINVKAGQLVKKGDTLATLDATFIRADENQLRLRLESLETQAKGLDEELSGKSPAAVAADSADGQLQANIVSERRANYRAQKLKMEETSAKLRAALATNRRDQSLIANRLKALREIESMQEKLVAQKIGAPLQLMEAQIRSKEVERELTSVSLPRLMPRKQLLKKGGAKKPWKTC